MKFFSYRKKPAAAEASSPSPPPAAPAAPPMTQFLPHPPPPSVMPGAAPSNFNSTANSTAASTTGIQSTSSSAYLEDIKHDVMVSYLYQQQISKSWIHPGAPDEGVLLRKARSEYVCYPESLGVSHFRAACAALDVQVAITVNSRVVKSFLQWQSADAYDVPLGNGHRLQIVPSMRELPRARKHQFAAFLAEELLLVVWDDDPLNVMMRAQNIESELMQLVWNSSEAEKADGSGTVVEEIDLEAGGSDYRPTHLLNTILVAITLVIITAMLGLGYRQIAIQTKVDGNYLRILLVLLTPIQVFFTLFFAQVVVGCLAQLFGPVSQLTHNSRFYSAIAPPRSQTGTLPHVTIQCPVYKEGLASVIQPTVKSIKKAINTYELQGGTANIFINDDGLQLLSAEDREKRISFYADHNIGWVARPKHDPNGTGFLRRGKFKKASNMNFALNISCKIEDELANLERGENWTQAQEATAYEEALKKVVVADGRAWADGNIRVGDYILLIDSDTRVPVDCLLDAASEMELSPEVGILQYSSGVMQVVNHYFENGITFFTNIIYSAIRYTVANGDVAPFVGHNAMLRWSAVQQVSYTDSDNYEKFWSEYHVSEDFDMSLRLQCAGYIIRLAAYAGDGFKEGVSLTVYDELARWEKYAYGCNELLFHPIRFWPVRGPFTKLFRTFITSNVRITSKITIISYIGTYYAIAAAWIMTTANYFAIGWFNGYLDKYYIDSWKVWFSIVIVFNLLGNIALAVVRYRLGEKSFFSALLENFKWIPLLAVFLGGLSLHVSQALLSHMFEIDMTWGATSKEAEVSNFFLEAPKVLRKFKFSFTFGTLGCAAMVIFSLGNFVPEMWRITDFVAILPMATVVGSHMLLPVILNPALMTFQW